MDHAEALQRHALHKQQLAEVVRLHKERLTAAGSDSSQEEISEKNEAIDDPVENKNGEVTDLDDNTDKENDSPTSTYEPLSDLQEYVIDNLELIAKLVQQVSILDKRAKTLLFQQKEYNDTSEI